MFVQCAGQRDATGAHLPYCSGHCCATSIKQAMYFKDANPEVDTVVALHRPARARHGRGLLSQRPGQGRDLHQGPGHEGRTPARSGCSVQLRDLILDEDATIAADLVVLATGQVPNSGVNIDLPDEDPVKEQTDLDPESRLSPGQGPAAAAPRLHRLALHLLSLRDPPHRHLRRRPGAPADGHAQAADDATGAALKAIQAVENAAPGRAAHPRSGDLSYPIVRLEGCTQCKRCTVECPFGAIDEDEKRFPVFNESRCRRCGTCMGACPVRVISFENYSVDTVGSQIKAVDMPDEFSEKPRILLLACENDAYPALDMAGHVAHRLLGLRACDPGALPGLGEHDLDHRCAEPRLRRRDDDGLQEGRRLPVPLRQGLGAGALPHEQDRRHAQAARPRDRARGQF